MTPSDTVSACVLLVEDEAAHATLIASMLLRVPATVEWAATGADALERLRARKFDLVILDLHLPDMSGLAVLRWMREQGQATPVIIATIEDAAERRSEAARQGAAAYVLKGPGYLDILTTAAHAALAQRP